VLLIGDVHRRFYDYLRLVEKEDQTLQLGDMGIYDAWDRELISANHHRGNWFIRGNHDNPMECRATKGYVNQSDQISSVWCFGGAFSHDRDKRTPGVDWWPDEQFELTIADAYVNLFRVERPSVVATHDCPEDVTRAIHGDYRWPNATGALLQRFWMTHQPDLWVFGHHHRSFDQTINGTRFVCLNELEVLRI
jgi:hypothetical protein